MHFLFLANDKNRRDVRQHDLRSDRVDVQQPILRIMSSDTTDTRRSADIFDRTWYGIIGLKGRRGVAFALCIPFCVFAFAYCVFGDEDDSQHACGNGHVDNMHITTPLCLPSSGDV